MPRTAARSSSIESLYQDAVKYAKDRAGGERAFWIIGATLRKGLVAQAILQTLYAQDDEYVSAERVREILNTLYERLGDDESLSA